MKKSSKSTTAIIVAAAATILSVAQATNAAIIITEVDSAGSSTPAYGEDWFELTNTGSTAESTSGWTMDDNSDSVASSVPMTGITINPGQSAIYIESDGSTFATASALESAFEASWFGGTPSNPTIPAGFTISDYAGKSVGLSTSGDGVNIFDNTGTQIAGVTFATTSVGGATFDNSAGLNYSAAAGDPVLTMASVAGVDGAFDSASSSEIGSPGAVPEPASAAILVLAAGAMLVRRRSRVALQ